MPYSCHPGFMAQEPRHIPLNPLEKDKTHAEKRGGNIHIVNSTTGVTEMIIANIPKGMPQELVEVELPDGTRVLVQKALAPTTKNTWDVPFSETMIDLICNEIVNGLGITQICEMPGFPSYITWSRWRREHPWIEEAVAKARVDRAERSRDKVLAFADQAQSTKDPINATNTKIEAYKWSAAIDDPGKYSPRAKMEAVISAPTQIIVHTGIDRGPIKDVTPAVEEKKSVDN